MNALLGPLGGWGGGHVEARVGSCRAAAEMANAKPEQPVGKETAPNGGPGWEEPA